MSNRLQLSIATATAVIFFALRAAAQIPQYDHVVILIEENKTYSQIIGNTDPANGAPYLNSVANSGALFANSHAIEHPSQPNYLDIYSGFNQGVLADTTSPLVPFSTANLGASLISHGFSFSDYSETLPFSLPGNRGVAVDPSTPAATAYGYTGDSFSTDPGLNEYERKHNPAVNWQNDSNSAPGNAQNQLPSTTNQPFTAFPSDFSQLPTLSIVVPNEQHDMHDGTINQGDVWAMANIESYRQWALTHNSLLIITWDENDDEDLGDPAGEGTNQIVTIFSGQNVIPGQYGELVTHFNVLRTLDDMYGLPPENVGDSAATPITDVFVVPEPSTFSLAALGGILALVWKRLFSRKKKPRRRRAYFYSCSAVAVFTIGVSSLRATTVITPNELPDPNSFGALPAAQTYGDTSNLFPFFPGTNNPLRYQQVYDASQFATFVSGGEDITQIAFRVGINAPDRMDSGAFVAAIALIQITLSTTSASPDSLSNTFADNIGANAVTVFGTPGVGSPLAISSTGAVTDDPAPFDITITLTTPFHYDPTMGNLLLVVQNYSGAESFTGVELDGTMVEGDSVSRVFNFGNAGAATASDADTSGLVTKFIAVPEPTSAVLFCLAGFVLLLSLQRRFLRKL